MPVTLDAPISWQNPPTADDAAMLDNLQPNILKPHTRDFLAILFLRFTNAAAGRGFLREITPWMKSARTHLAEIQRFKADKTQPGSPYLGVGLTAPGYEALGVGTVPSDPSFIAGMQNAGLNDPDVASWDPHFRDRNNLHAVVLIGDTMMEPVSTLHDAVVSRINAYPGVVVLGTQDGRGLHNANGDGIEHFGYVDGRSQPLFFAEDMADEELSTDGIVPWNPAAPLAQAIVPDPGMPASSVHFGSYFVFRKLEQNVRLFKEHERQFAEDLGLDDDERAGAMLVGRFEDGTPVTMQAADGMHHPVPNSFNYASDGAGAKCPFLGHIRKTNPRGSAGFEPPPAERRHQMARRGQTYGVRVDNPNDSNIGSKPERNVGLLFMAFNSDIGQQFEFMQAAWANNPDFPTPHAGVDPIIGQTPGDATRAPMTCPVTWGKNDFKVVDPMPRTVTMKGGEYFFMPSLDFLRQL